jgi:hypothetical protein
VRPSLSLRRWFPLIALLAVVLLILQLSAADSLERGSWGRAWSEGSR